VVNEDEEVTGRWERTRVLVVGADRPRCLHIALRLARNGLAVQVTASGRDALARELSDIELLILETELADGSGIAVLRQLRERGVTAPALLLTGHPDGELFRRAAELDAALVVAA
jgi:DNA-binding response OmpR family regulator